LDVWIFLKSYEKYIVSYQTLCSKWDPTRGRRDKSRKTKKKLLWLKQISNRDNACLAGTHLDATFTPACSSIRVVYRQLGLRAGHQYGRHFGFRKFWTVRFNTSSTAYSKYNDPKRKINSPSAQRLKKDFNDPTVKYTSQTKATVDSYNIIVPYKSKH
jgi:hypothetical protein